MQENGVEDQESETCSARAGIGLNEARVELKSMEGERGTKRCRPMFGVDGKRGTAANHAANDDGPPRPPPLSGCDTSHLVGARR